MATKRKIENVADLKDKLQRTQATLVTDYRGLTVAEISALRRKLREADAELIVAKNTLTLLAAKETGYDQALEPLLKGPTALAFAYGDAAKVAKTITEFNRGPKKLNVRGGLLGTAAIQGDALDQISKMPTRQQVLAEVVGGIAAPVSGVVGVINAAITNVLYVLQARIDQVQGGSEAAA